MNWIIKIIIALLVFSVIVVIHELGHFLLAKKNGVGVTEFSIGMGPRLFSFDKGGTKYSIKALPLGGSCMMVGEDEASTEDNAFNNKGVWARISIIAAGPIFNFILAFILSLIVVGYSGWDFASLKVMENMPAAEAGLKDGDIVTKVNGKGVSCSRELMYALYFSPIESDKPVTIEYKRDGKKHTKKITPEFVSEYNITGVTLKNGEDKVEIDKIDKKSPFDKAGIKSGDVMVGINGKKFETMEEFSDVINNIRMKRTITVDYVRNGKTKTVDVKLAKKSLTEKYMLGFSYSNGNKKVSALQTIKYAFVEIKVQINVAIQSLKYLISGKASAKEISGPIGIVNFIGDDFEAVKKEGFMTTFIEMLSITILLSANIGVMNLLPIPALDGGRLIFMYIELIRRKPIKPEVEGMIHAIGLILLLILMAFVSFNDVMGILKK